MNVLREAGGDAVGKTGVERLCLRHPPTTATQPETDFPMGLFSLSTIVRPATPIALMDIGASLIQIYTGMLYRGPGFIGDLVRGLNRS